AAAAQLGAAEPALKDLTSQTEGALAKLVLNQLASLPQPDASQQVWRFDIPFTLAGNPSSAKLEIEREAYREGQGESDSAQDSAPWTVTVELNPPGLGKFGGKVTLHQGAINAFFWSDDPTTADLVRDNLPLLEARLEAAGLKTGRLDASVGVAPASAAKPLSSMPLLDLHA
ncbi:flagellar hook-length control protein FliK, partial [Methylogaea oryzae]